MKRNYILGFLFLLFSQMVFAFNPQDLKQLQETCSCPGCDLSHANLSNFILGDNKTLNTEKVKPNNEGFIVCNISHANFTGANLQNAYFSPADFGPGINSKVGKIVMRGSNFSGANLSGAHFNAVVADRSNFKNTNLQNAKIMKSASFKYCNFSYAMMNNISISPPMGGCGAVFTNSNFINANLSNSKLNADFTHANFMSANLSNTQLIPCDDEPQNAFQGTNFTRANLTKASSSGNQVLTEDTLSKAILCQTKFGDKVSNRNCP